MELECPGRDTVVILDPFVSGQEAAGALCRCLRNELKRNTYTEGQASVEAQVVALPFGPAQHLPQSSVANFCTTATRRHPSAFPMSVLRK